MRKEFLPAGHEPMVLVPEKDYCEMQEKIAAHERTYQTLKREYGKYVEACRFWEGVYSELIQLLFRCLRICPDKKIFAEFDYIQGMISDYFTKF